MAGTAAATYIGQIPATASNGNAIRASGVEIFNLTTRNLELAFVPADIGVTAYTNMTPAAGTVVTLGQQGALFCPGTASGVASGRSFRQDIALQGGSGMNLFLRTTENTPITATSVNPFVINFWA